MTEIERTDFQSSKKVDKFKDVDIIIDNLLELKTALGQNLETKKK
jgi:hypothetical protein